MVLGAVAQVEKQTQRAELTHQEARRHVIALAWPAVVEQLLVTLFGMVDMMMVGAVGPQAIAAIGLTNQPMFLALAAFQALNVGTTALVARFVGAGDISGSERRHSSVAPSCHRSRRYSHCPSLYFCRTHGGVYGCERRGSWVRGHLSAGD